MRKAKLVKSVQGIVIPLSFLFFLAIFPGTGVAESFPFRNVAVGESLPAATLTHYKSREQASEKAASFWLNRGYYLEASYYLFKGPYDQARVKLNHILSNANPMSDPAMAVWPLLKIGMSYDIEGQREKALDYYRRILAADNASGAQFLAEKYIDEPAEEGDPFLGY